MSVLVRRAVLSVSRSLSLLSLSYQLAPCLVVSHGGRRRRSHRRSLPPRDLDSISKRFQPMDRIDHRKSSPSERFLGFFSSPPGALTASNGGIGVELDEDEVLWTGGDASASDLPPAESPREAMFPGSSVSSSPRSFRLLSEKKFGILAALPEEDQKIPVRNPSFLRRSVSSLSGTSSASVSPSTSSARMIPLAPRPRVVDYSPTAQDAKIQQQSAPVNVPVVRSKPRRGFWERTEDDESGDTETLPPHEITARKDSPMTTFSVLEGAGRTLKGRDLRQVRNAVWRQTGFID